MQYQLGTGPQEFNLGVGNDYDPIGAVAVWVDSDTAPTKLFLRYRTEGGWMISETHLAVASGADYDEALAKIPTAPGQMDNEPFPEGYYGAAQMHDPAVNWYIYEIPLGSPYFNVKSGDWLMIAAHATVLNKGENGSAWAEGSSFDPVVPIPELPALVLLGGGLLGIAGYILIRRKKTVSAVR
ncbi:MAG TPA: LPXTG cell wall anchor domain-containing protein [Dehalococcoidales bacterium]|nr:LPXTG cell wall anchor domain-containing protein [Dehalococcoidales bacterium]